MTQIIFSPSELQFASQFIRDLHQVDVDSLPLPEDGMASNIPDPCVIVSALANLVDPESKKLGDSDFYYLLSHPDRFGNNPEAEKILRKALFFPETDPEGIRLGFHTVNDEHGNQTAYVRLTPASKGKGDPIVYLGGLHHSSAGYLKNLATIARETNREIIIVDLPTMGGSILAKGESVGPDELVTASLSAIYDAFPDGVQFVLAGHSLGTVVAKMIYDHQPEVNQSGYLISKLILDAPVPTIEDAISGYSLSGNWTAKTLASDIIHGGTIVPIDLVERFINAHSEEEIKALAPYINRSRYESNIIDVFRTFFSNYFLTTMKKIGHDPKLRILVHKNDQLFQMENLKSWEGRGIYTTAGDHDAAVGFDSINQEYIIQFERALTEDLNSNQPPPDVQDLYRRVRPQFSVGVVGVLADTETKTGPEISLGLRAGLLKTSLFGMSIDGGSRVQLGYNLTGKTPFAQSNSFVGNTIELMHLPINFSGGYFLNIPLMTSRISETGFYLGLEAYVPKVFNLRLEYQHTFLTLNGQTNSPNRGLASLNVPF